MSVTSPDIAMRFLKRENKELRRHLTALTNTVEQALAALDREMKRPSSPERGARIATISNALELQKDMAVRYGLGEDRFKKGKQAAGPTVSETGPG